MTTTKVKQMAQMIELRDVVSGLTTAKEELALYLPLEWDEGRVYAKNYVKVTKSFLSPETIARLEQENENPALVDAQERLKAHEAETKQVIEANKDGDFQAFMVKVTELAKEANALREEIERLSSVDGIIEAAVNAALSIEAPDVYRGDSINWRQAVGVVQDKFPDSDGSLILFRPDNALVKAYKLPKNLVGDVAMAVKHQNGSGQVDLQIVGQLEPNEDEAPSTLFKRVNSWLTGHEGTNGINSTSAFKEEIGTITAVG